MARATRGSDLPSDEASGLELSQALALHCSTSGCDPGRTHRLYCPTFRASAQPLIYQSTPGPGAR